MFINMKLCNLYFLRTNEKYEFEVNFSIKYLNNSFSFI